MFRWILTEYFITVFRKLVLLAFAAMVLEWQNHRIIRGHESSVSYRIDHVFEQDVGAHSPTMGYDRFFVVSST